MIWPPLNMRHPEAFICKCALNFTFYEVTCSFKESKQPLVEFCNKKLSYLVMCKHWGGIQPAHTSPFSSSALLSIWCYGKSSQLRLSTCSSLSSHLHLEKWVLPCLSLIQVVWRQNVKGGGCTVSNRVVSIWRQCLTDKGPLTAYLWHWGLAVERQSSVCQHLLISPTQHHLLYLILPIALSLSPDTLSAPTLISFSTDWRKSWCSVQVIKQ